MKRQLLLALGVAALGSSAWAQGFIYPDFTSTAGINPVGLTTQAGAVLRLQDNVAPAVGSDNRGAAWYDTAVQVVGGFDTTFVYRMHTPSTTGGSDGLAFVIQNDQIAGSVPIVNGSPDGTGNLAIGRHAAAAGFGQFVGSPAGDSIDNSLAIHFDTYFNGVWNDLDSNHISVHTGGSADNHQDEDFSIGRVALATPDLNDGVAHTVRVLYVPGTLEIHLDGLLVLSVPYDFNTGGVWVNSSTPVGGLSLIGGTSAFVGFTSGAGTAREFRDIESWSWTSGSGGASTFCAQSKPTTVPGCTPSLSATDISLATGTWNVGNVPLGPAAGGTSIGIFIYQNGVGLPQSTFSTNVPFGLLCLNPFLRSAPACAPVTIAGGGINVCHPGFAPFSPNCNGGALGISVGDSLNVQSWYRDPGAIGNANFTNAIYYTIL